MKKYFLKSLSRLYPLFIFLLLSVAGSPVVAQVQDIPRGDEAGRLELDSTAQIITFIVIPLLFIGLYIWLRKRKKNR